MSKSEIRKDLIAGAVIKVIAKVGARGLTHREVDRHLKLPQGSTSFYFRRRSDLLRAGFEKLIAGNLRNMQQSVRDVLGEAESTGPVSLRQMADYLYRGWLRGSRPDNRLNGLARFEFFLAAARDPALRKMEDRVLQKLFAIDLQLCERMGVKNPRWVAAEIGNFRRGEIMTLVLVPSAIWGRKPTLAYYETRLRHIIAEGEAYTKDLPAGKSSVRRQS